VQLDQTANSPGSGNSFTISWHRIAKDDPRGPTCAGLSVRAQGQSGVW
jgi:hypothetical protein